MAKSIYSCSESFCIKYIYVESVLIRSLQRADLPAVHYVNTNNVRTATNTAPVTQIPSI
ncbi:hypothetical protein CAL7102_08067 [Dulcicalothrix desertica PCC 7102]|nr:hypothetical protein CAL7102_08067 [Dulcicalothrix desertica PCC 7102]